MGASPPPVSKRPRRRTASASLIYLDPLAILREDEEYLTSEPAQGPESAAVPS
eukprot:CAMPEP_0194544376 /NCGR_PEP_ID=MMETSP0253-20130528/87445_1 /TAXON_ID=2966 /ORGANISM="Noctiluca scintillans" /LENGTH=52 /DNA_ID=CAMNT_0039391255 /DNA_START=173 /DNA_END=328 /DNA_ORIENTATION=-